MSELTPPPQGCNYREYCILRNPDFVAARLRSIMGALGPELALQARLVITNLGCSGCEVNESAVIKIDHS